MYPKIFFLFHVHSDRSHDSSVSVQDYVAYLERTLKENEYAVLGISDHNVLPLSTDEAMRLSTAKVLVIPGIQWRLHKSIKDAFSKLVMRRDVLTFGNHDDLPEYVQKLRTRVLKNGEIAKNLTEQQLLDYLGNKKEMILVIPHPKHFIVDYYGRKQIRHFKAKIEEQDISIPFFVEDKTGYDPFPRIFYKYKGKYLTMAGPDAHQIVSALGTKSLFSVEAYISCIENEKVLELWRAMLHDQRHESYGAVMGAVFKLIVDKNHAIHVRKHYLRTNLQFFHAVPAWARRRFDRFPHNLLR